MSSSYRWWSYAVLFLTLCFAVAETTAQGVSLPTLYATASTGTEGCSTQRCFGGAVAFNRDTIVTSSGDIVVVARDVSNVWKVQQVLKNPDNGNALAMDGAVPTIKPAGLGDDVVLVEGTSSRYNFKNVVYVFTLINGEWRHTQTLTLARPADFTNTRVKGIAVHGNFVLINGIREGAGQRFTQIDFYLRGANGQYARRGSFRPPNSDVTDSAFTVDVHGNYAVVGDSNAAEQTGRAYIYEYGAGGWVLRRTLAPPAGPGLANFGAAVAIDEFRIAI